MVGGQRRKLAALTPEKTLYPFYRRLGGPQSRSGRVRKIWSPPGFDTPNRPARSHSLYRLHYPGPQNHCTKNGAILYWKKSTGIAYRVTEHQPTNRLTKQLIEGRHFNGGPSRRPSACLAIPAFYRQTPWTITGTALTLMSFQSRLKTSTWTNRGPMLRRQ
jgi:hypothetical protein